MSATVRARVADLALAFAIALCVTVSVGVTAQSVGFTRDEGYYFKAAEEYWGWFDALGGAWARGAFAEPFTAAVIDEHWSYNHEHPAGMKTLFALGFGVQKMTGVPASVHNAIRAPAWTMAGLSAAFVFLLARAFLARRAAVLAALLWVSMPHVYWHMHVACFDIAIAAGHTWLVLAWWKGRRSVGGAVLCGVAFAAAAAMKHNVLPVPALFVLHWVVCEARMPAPSSATHIALPRIPWAFLAMALLAPILYVAHWPWLWVDPLRRFGAYLGFHLRHEHYPILYFKDLLTHPPFPVSFPFVMSAVTVPVPVLALFCVGFVLAVAVAARFVWARFVRPGVEPELTRVPLGDVAHDPSGSAAFLLALNALVPFVLIALPSTPIFGGTKHWMNALPFLCVLGAWALEETFARASAAWASIGQRAFIIVALVVVVPGVWISARVWPYGLGAYNELIGFTRGAANVGMQRTFWGYEPRLALPIVNERAPANARLHFGDTNNDDYRMYKRDGLLRSDISISGTVRGAHVASVQPQGEFKDQWMDVWNDWDDRSPDVVLHAEGVPMCTVTFKGRTEEP